MTTRPPAVAGAFYPSDPTALGRLVDRLLGSVDVEAGTGAGVGAGVSDDGRPAAAYVAPHAGYRYSGPVAAEVYARLGRHAPRVRRVVLIGPAHRVPLDGCAVSGADRWRTPLGEVTVDVAGARALADEGLVTIDDEPHALEHSLEVQVPFLQRVLDPAVSILPVCVGRESPDRVAAVISTALGAGGDAGTVIICSTDLSHYQPDAQARAQDRRTAAAIADLAPERIGVRDACGVFALRGLLRWAQEGARVVQLALATSADTAGDPARVVGYPAFALYSS